MTRVAIILLSLLPALTSAAAADNLMEAGEWKVTSTGVVNGAVNILGITADAVIAAWLDLVRGAARSDFVVPKDRRNIL